MRIAVLHHRCRGEATADVAALVEAARSACKQDAEVIVFPRPPSLAGMPIDEREALLADIDGCVEGVALLVSFAADDDTTGRITATPLGTTALVSGDACLRAATAARIKEARVNAGVWRPGAESELQAEAVLEYALGCAPVLAGLLVLAECSGTTGHSAHSGTSAIIHLGELLAESVSADDEILMVDVEVPLPAPESDLPLPGLTPLLVQRLAAHDGHKAPVDYPADLT